MKVNGNKFSLKVKKLKKNIKIKIVIVKNGYTKLSKIYKIK